jgi:hypothetical protein
VSIENKMRSITLVLPLMIVILFGLLLIGCTKSCKYDTQEKNYIGKSADECSKIRYRCDSGDQPFSDACGCGCEVNESAQRNINQTATDNSAEVQNICAADQRQALSCLEIFEPVCGWYNQQIQCFRYPCAQTYSNSCFACSDAKVEYWTTGECPK